MSRSHRHYVGLCRAKSISELLVASIGTMNTIELTSVLSANEITREWFSGVYSRDTLPKAHITKRPCGLIANLDASDMPGSHWTCFFLPATHSQGKKPNEFFDSYNANLHGDFEDFLYRNGDSFITSSRQIQGDLSEICGQYCCIYLHYRCANRSFDEFLNLFSRSNVEENDKKALQMYNRFFVNNK